MSALANYRFRKMNGLGNEIVVVDMRRAPLVVTTADARMAAAAVHFDQMMVLYPARAPEIMRRYGCGGCHTIPGLAGADGQVGPPLTGLVHRVYVGGGASNSPDNLITWIVSPQTFAPHTAMPATGITEAEARDVAAYLYAQ